jgi:hypothetical protein
MKTILEVNFEVLVDLEELTREELVKLVGSITRLSQIYMIPSVDRDSIKLKSIEVK